MDYNSSQRRLALKRTLTRANRSMPRRPCHTASFLCLIAVALVLLAETALAGSKVLCLENWADRLLSVTYYHPPTRRAGITVHLAPRYRQCIGDPTGDHVFVLSAKDLGADTNAALTAKGQAWLRDGWNRGYLSKASPGSLHKLPKTAQILLFYDHQVHGAVPNADRTIVFEVEKSTTGRPLLQFSYGRSDGALDWEPVLAPSRQ